MNNAMFWLLVFPVLLLAALYYLGFLTIGLAFISRAFKSGNPAVTALMVLIGVGVIISPFAAQKIQRERAEARADALLEEFANMERASLAGRMPARFITVGSYSPKDIAFIKSRYGLSEYPDTEQKRLREAYRLYRRAEFCHKYLYKERISPKVNISNCRKLPASLQEALEIKEPILVFADGSNVSLRRSNTIVGKMYEIRLVTPTQDLLVDYYEERAIDDPPGITNPFSEGRTLASEGRPPTRQEFIEQAMTKASR